MKTTSLPPRQTNINFFSLRKALWCGGLVIISIVLFCFATAPIKVLAQETELPAVSQAELPDPGTTPDSPFYFLEIVIEEIGTFFTFGDIKKAERYLTLANERLAETQAIIEKNKPELVEKTLQRYETKLNKALARIEKVQNKDTTTVELLVGRASSIHLGVLAKVYEKVPEQAKPAIENAITVSVKGREKAVEALKAKNALGEIPETISLPAEIPQEVRERIQKKVQAELIIEQTLQGSKSLRALCIEKGEGPQDMCEKIPVKGFKSFESLEAFCTEVGQTPELCAALESTCKEFGVTIPDKCFVFLSSNKVEITPVEQAAPIPEQAPEKLEEKKPEQAKESNSQSFEFIKAKCLEDGGPLEICTKLANDIQNPKSPRAFCVEMGGPSEECEKIPLSLGSFEAIEALCIESGGPSDQCATLVNKCNEYGVTTPDACFRFLSTAAITTYSSTELKAVPAPTLPEEEMEQEESQGEPQEQSTETEEEPKQVYIPGVSKVIIYSTATCPHCVLAIQWFQENNIEYEEIDISENETVQNELMEKVGQLAVPIIEVENNIMVGFSEETFSELFGVE